MNALSLDAYAAQTSKTAIYPNSETVVSAEAIALHYLGLKLAGESGEVAEGIGKALRDDWAHGDLVDYLTAELGDVIWYVAQIAKTIGVPLSTIAQYNLDKLKSRSERGVIGGSGDYR